MIKKIIYIYSLAITLLFTGCSSNVPEKKHNTLTTPTPSPSSILTPTPSPSSILTPTPELTWSKIDIKSTDHFFDIDFVDRNFGWLVGGEPQGVVFHTKNGGITWEKQIIPVTQSLRSVSFVDKSNGWVCGKKSTIIYTSNGGEFWNSSANGMTSELFLTSIFFIDKNLGWCGGEMGELYRTVDSGKNWKRQYGITVRQQVRNISGTSENNLWSVLYSGELYKYSGEDSWIDKTPMDFTKQYRLDNNILNGVSFSSDSKFGILVGEKGTILITQDGGENWSKSRNIPSIKLNKVQVLDNKNAFVVGDNGTILFTSDGAVTWTIQKSPINENLNNIFMFDQSSVWIVGNNGTLLKYTSK